jgi:hypothetical protein
MYQPAANHTVSGVRVSWKIVPAVRETRFVHAPHRQTLPDATAADAVRPHTGQTGPAGFVNANWPTCMDLPVRGLDR